MKILRIIEKIVFLVAVALGSAALALSFLFDEAAAAPAVGIASTALTFLTLGGGALLLVLLIGAFLRYSKNEVAGRLGDAFCLMAFLALFGLALAVLSNPDSVTGMTILLAMVSGIIYIVDWIVRFIIFIVKIVKPTMESEDPENDERIQCVLKWKQLLDQGIISKEEFEAKRVKILGLEEPKPVVEPEE